MRGKPVKLTVRIKAEDLKAVRKRLKRETARRRKALHKERRDE